MPVRRTEFIGTQIENLRPDHATDCESSDASESLIRLAKMLGLTVVAEGVETESRCRFLREQQCDRAQGFLVSRPIEPEKAFSLMTAAKGPLNWKFVHVPPPGQ